MVIDNDIHLRNIYKDGEVRRKFKPSAPSDMEINDLAPDWLLCTHTKSSRAMTENATLAK